MLNNPLIANTKKTLIVCPHTDDEYGCAGFVSRLIESGVEVHYLALSRCEESVPAHLPQDILEWECRESTKRLGIAEENVRILRYRVRHFPAFRQDILEEFVRISRSLSPDLVLLPSSYDTHQDHATVYMEGFRAFKHASILGYELPQNLNSFSNAALVKLSPSHLEAKIHALSSYQSQDFRKYSASVFIESLARVRGVQCNAEFAEAFEVIRLVI